MLEWAREWLGKSVEEAAAKINKKPEEVANWEGGIGAPTVRQARILADFYERPFLEFFLTDPPDVPLPELVPDFRMHAGKIAPEESRDLQLIQQWAEAQRTNALGLYQDVGDAPASLPETLFATVEKSPEAIATAARDALNFPIQEQVNLPRANAYQLPTILRRKIESVGILTLRHSDLGQFDVRGICLAEFPLPVILFGSEASAAQAFTLAHELGHILIKASGVTGPRRAGYNANPIERWCDRFAASFLMPERAIRAYAGNRPISPESEIEDNRLKKLADIFRVSNHAMLIRLVHLRYVREEFYWEIKKPFFDQIERNLKQFGRAPFYGARYKSRMGDLYTGLVLEAWATGRITNHHAAEYMGIKNLQHLNDIRENAAPV
jgi:Zn-dependent peptidase ImmA (M78 family)/transcriptional regulator with XRE-family HTH domain